MISRINRAKPVKPKYRIEVFRKIGTRLEGQQIWRWHLQSLVGVKPLLCTSGEAYYSRANAMRAARRMVKLLAVPVDFVFEVA